MLVAPLEAYRLWSASYDGTPNPLLHLESRLIAELLDIEGGSRILDAGCGTGRWMSRMMARGGEVFGVDLCPEMIALAARKPGLAGRCGIANVARMPFADQAFDIAVCSFTFGYLPSIEAALRELARTSRLVIASDVHPEALRNGWTRSFRSGADRFEIEDFPYSLAHMDGAAKRAGLFQRWRIEAPIGEPEFEIFQRAGKEAAFEEATGFPAVVITAWDQQSA